jgi:hypothetical protein
VKEESGRTVLNSDTEEVVELTQILHRELVLESSDDPAEKWLVGGGEDNVINIEQQVCSVGSMVVDEQGRIRLGLHEPHGGRKL